MLSEPKTAFVTKFIIAIVVAASIFGVQRPRAAELATPDEAKAMALRAADYLKVNGPEKAFAVFNDKSSEFHDRDLYVFVYDSFGKAVAHGANSSLIGRNLIELKEVEGKSFVRHFVAIKEAGWVDYKWQNPQTKQVDSKSSYIVRVGDDLVGVGAYRKWLHFMKSLGSAK